MQLNFNWKQGAAAITSSLSILALVPQDLYYGSLKDFAEVVPVAWKPRIVLLGLIATVFLRVWNALTTPNPKVNGK